MNVQCIRRKPSAGGARLSNASARLSAACGSLAEDIVKFRGGGGILVWLPFDTPRLYQLPSSSVLSFARERISCPKMKLLHS